MNILILAAGLTEHDNDDGNYPLYLSEFDGVPMIEKIIRTCETLSPKKIIFASSKEEINRFHIDNVIARLSPEAVTLKVHGDTMGAACTALLAAAYIDRDEELLILSANEIVDINLADLVAQYRARGLDAGTVTFPSIHPRYSYVRVGRDNLVTEAAEKNPISNHATASMYWYARGSDFIKAAKNMIRKEAHIDGIYYICPAFNEMVLAHAKIGVHPIDPKKYHPLKTSRQRQHFEASHAGGMQ